MEQINPFQQAYQAPCPACAHRLLLHRAGRCEELTGPPKVQLEAGDFNVFFPACGCPALQCDCGHGLSDHGSQGCEHRLRDRFDRGERDCDCRMAALQIWDAAVSSQNPRWPPKMYHLWPVENVPGVGGHLKVYHP